MDTKQEQRMRSGPLIPLILSLSLPSVVAQLINVLYNIVDRMYIGHIPGEGAQALTGLGVSFPIIMIISAFSAFAGAGGAPLAAIELGRGNREGAEKILGSAITMLLAFSVILTVLFQIFKRPLLYLFGASDNTIEYACNYLGIYLIGTIFVQLALGMNMFISSQGQAKTAMLSVLIGAASNIILDPIFIFVLKLGVRGAALATILSQALSAIWVFRFLTGNKTSMRIRLANIIPSKNILLRIAALGISPFIMQSTESLITIVFNSGLQHYGGDLYVGSMTIMQSVMQLVVIPIQGFTQGCQPIISFNYGAGQTERVKKTCRIVIATAFFAAALFTLVVIRFPGVFAGMFSNDAQLIEIVKQMMPIYMFGMLIFGVQMGCQTTFMGLGQAKFSLFLALLRKVILLIPLALILPRFFGVTGIYFSEPIADIISAITAGTLLLLNINKILAKRPDKV